MTATEPRPAAGVWRPSMETQVARPTLWQDLWNTMLRVYAMLLGNIDLEVFETAEYDVFYQIMFLAFVYMQTVLLLNLVIAMMGESFEKVLQAAQKELTADRAELLIRVELSLGVQRMRSRGYLPRYLQVRAMPGAHSSEREGARGVVLCIPHMATRRTKQTVVAGVLCTPPKQYTLCNCHYGEGRIEVCKTFEGPGTQFKPLVLQIRQM